MDEGLRRWRGFGAVHEGRGLVIRDEPTQHPL